MVLVTLHDAPSLDKAVDKKVHGSNYKIQISGRPAAMNFQNGFYYGFLVTEWGAYVEIVGKATRNYTLLLLAEQERLPVSLQGEIEIHRKANEYLIKVDGVAVVVLGQSISNNFDPTLENRVAQG